MAKALLGHVGNGADLRLVAELRRLKARVRELEGELHRAQAVNEALVATMDDDFLRLTAREAEPALA